MGITVVRPGMLTTVQDGGRYGAQHLGVPVGGPMDWWCHEAANRLAGNGPDAATLEVTLIGPELELSRTTIAAVVGANFALTLTGSRSGHASGRSVAMNQAFLIEAGDRLAFGERTAGARAYVAFAGGVAVPPVMGSRATHVKAALGGHDGRALQRDDVLPLGATARQRAEAASAIDVPHLSGAAPDVLRAPAMLRAIEGPEGAPAAFWDAVFTISPQSDRMGYRLDGPALAAPGDQLSSGVTMGTVQVTPSGTCVLLMADRATSGGYARAASVITADLPRAGQLAPGDTVTFCRVTPDEAGEALAATIARLPPAPA